MKNEISVIILTKDSEKYLKECLNALKWFDEVVILDNGSNDNTLKIAKSFKNVKIIQHQFIGFGYLKNLAIKKTKNSWILSIDSDEIVSEKLLNEIKKLNLEDEKSIYLINRLNHYNKKPIKCCGWYPDRVLRLFNKNYTQFSNVMVHESIIIHKDDSRI